MAKIKRYEWAHFFNTGTPESKVWSRINKGFTELTEDSNAEVVEEKYIGDKNSSTSIESYAPSIGLSGSAYKGDAVFDLLDTMHRTRAVGAECEVELLNVDIYNPGEGNSYPAILQPAVVEITSWGGETMEVGATIHYNGDPTFGTATIDAVSKAVTFSAN